MVWSNYSDAGYKNLVKQLEILTTARFNLEPILRARILDENARYILPRKESKAVLKTLLYLELRLKRHLDIYDDVEKYNLVG